MSSQESSSSGTSGETSPSAEQGAPLDREEFGKTAARRLDALVERGQEDVLLTVLERELSGDIETATLDALRIHVQLLLGPEGTSTLMWLAQSEDATELEESLGSIAVAETTVRFLTSVVALYGPRIQLAWELADQRWNRRDDWEKVNRRVSQDLETGDYAAMLEIVKINGERMTIAGGSNSLIRLARQLLLAVAAVGDADAFAEEDVRRYHETVAAVEEMFGAEEA